MFMIDRASAGDLDSIVDAHIRAFPGFFLTRLGPRFLWLLYRGFAEDESGIMLVARNDSTICGFVAGTTTPEKFFSRLRRQWPAFLLASAAASIRAPGLVVRKLAGAAFYRGEAPVAIANAALLSSIGVPSEFAGRGLGKTLLAAFCEAARTGGCRYVYLTTDRDENPAVNRFYEAFGFSLEGTFAKPGNRWMNRYVFDLNHRTEPYLEHSVSSFRIAGNR